MGGWSSNSHYSLLGALRSAAQLVSYEVALSFALLSGVMLAGTLSMRGIVQAQLRHGVWGVFDNYLFMIVPFAIYIIAATAETNRAPFDLPEAESELVAGFHTEYSGFRWALYFLAEYANIFVVSSVAVTLFWGGWLRPFPSVHWLEIPLNIGFPVILFVGSAILTVPMIKKLKDPVQQKVLLLVVLLLVALAVPFLVPAVNAAVIGLFWFLLKVFAIVYLMIWFRGTFPRFRYDQLMNIGWKIAIPVGMGAVLVNALIGMARKYFRFQRSGQALRSKVMIQIRYDLSPASLLPKLLRLFELSGAKIRSIEDSWSPAQGAPVCTDCGQYTSRGWTEWTQGFQFGSAILQFDATGDSAFLEMGRERTVAVMAPHLTHTGVHDHGFNNISTYGTLLRLMAEGRIADDPWQQRFYELAVKCSGAVIGDALVAHCRPAAAGTFIPSTDRIPFLWIPCGRCAPYW